MNKRAKPVLSIGMIVKNEEKKLEKCLKALQPLRDALPCELVIADTGSTDGTRAIAERYADVVFDFVWVDDFSAARNAVMKKCSGSWYLTVDADEYLDAEVSELVSFLNSAEKEKTDAGYIKIRNYNTTEMLPGDCNEVLTCRMVRMKSGICYSGAIHESLQVGNGKVTRFFPKTILHHDGYAWKNEQDALSKMERNLSLLEKALEKSPNNARILMECIESSNFQPEKRHFYAHKAFALLQGGKKIEENAFSAPLARDACIVAVEEQLPEAEKWIDWTKKKFSKSVFVHIDVAYAEALCAHREKRYEDVIRTAEQYLAALDKFSEKSDQFELCISPLHRVKQTDRQRIMLMLAEAYGKTEHISKVWDLIHGWSFYDSAPEILSDWVRVMTLLAALPEAKQEARRVFDAAKAGDEGESVLQKAYVSSLLNLYWQHAGGIGVFVELPSILGDYARFISAQNEQERNMIIEHVTNWDAYPVPFAQAAIRADIALPDSFYQRPIEKLQDVVSLFVSWDEFYAAHALRFLQRDFSQTSQLQFAFLLASAVLRADSCVDEEQTEELCQCFFKFSDKFLSRYYNAAILQEDSIHLIPGLHRFAWYVLRSQEHISEQKWSEAVADLRHALENAPAMKHMVNYLLRQMEEHQRKSVLTPEMKALVQKIQSILAVYPADDPAVQMLKASPAYQKVAHLLDMMHYSEDNEEENI